MFPRKFWPGAFFTARYWPAFVPPLVFIRIRTRRQSAVSTRRGETLQSRRGVGVTVRREEP